MIAEGLTPFEIYSFFAKDRPGGKTRTAAKWGTGGSIMAGRKPLPTQMKILRGNPGKRALNNSEPKPTKKIPPCPRHLSKEARKEWRRVSKELFALGVLTVVDRAALAAYCQAWARWVEAEEAMQAPDFKMVATTDKGYQHISPWAQVAGQALKQMRAFLTEFGMTPASRSRVTTQAPEKEADPYSEFLGRKAG